MDCSTPGLSVHHQLPELAQTHVHWVGDAIQPSHPLSSPSPPSFNLSQHQGLSNESVLLVRWPKYWSFSFNISLSNEYSGLISFRMDWLDPLEVQGTLKTLLQHHSSKASILWCSAFVLAQLSHPYMTTGKTVALTRQIFAGKVMSLLFNVLSRLVIAFLPRNRHLLIPWLQSPSAVILEPPKRKSVTVSTVSPSICHEVMGPDAMILVFWMLSFKPTCSLSSFTFIKRLFSYSSLSAIRVVSSAYLRLLIFLPAILIPTCASPSPAFLLMYSACKLNKQVTALMYSIPYLEPVCCSMSSSNCCFMTCIQISQEADQVVWYSHLLKNFPQFAMIHTVKGFGVVNKPEMDVFLELSFFFNDPADVGNLVSGSSAFSKSSLNIWKFTVHVLLKPGLENFENYFASVWDEYSCAVVWAFFGIAFLCTWNENWPFPVLRPLLSFPNLLAYCV